MAVINPAVRSIGLLLFMLGLCVRASNAQIVFERTYGGTFYDAAFSVQQTADSGYIIAGQTMSFGAGGRDVYLLKTNPQGDTLWTRTYGGPADDHANSVQQTADSGYIIAGWTFTFGAGNGDVYLLKTNPLGDTQWTRTYGGPLLDCAFSVRQTADTGYIIVGLTYSFGAGLSDLYLLRINSVGDTLWTRTYGGAFAEEAYSVRQTSDSGYIAAGYTLSFGAGGGDVYLVRLNSAGDTLWTRTYGGAFLEDASSVQQTADSGYIIAGQTVSFGAGSRDVYLLRTNATGETLWTRTYGGPSQDHGYHVQETSDSGYIVAGYTSSFGAGNDDVYLLKTNASGDTLWTRTYGGAPDDAATSVQQTADGGYIVVGGTWSSAAGLADVYLVKTDRNGSILELGINNGWNLLSVPVTVSNDSTAIIFPTANSPAYAYDGGYTAEATLVSGEGYWLKYDSAQTIPMNGALRSQDSIAVSDGWNIIGSISSAVDVSTIVSDPPGLVTTQFFGYDSSYYTSDAIQPGKGYWVKVDQDGWLILPAPGNQSPVAGGICIVPTVESPPPAPADGPVDDKRKKPVMIALEQNYPNPFNPSTTINYELPTPGWVSLRVYNLFGQEVAVLVEGRQEAGYKTVNWDASRQVGVSSGVYFYRLQAGSFTETKRLLLMK